MSSLRRRGVSVVGVVLVTFVVGVPSASANLVEEVVEAGNTVVESATASLPGMLAPVTGQVPVEAPGAPQVPVGQAPESQPETAPTPPAPHTATAPSTSPTVAASRDDGRSSTSPATSGGVQNVGVLANAPREGAAKPARTGSGGSASERSRVAVDSGGTAGPHREPIRNWPAVGLAPRSAAPSDPSATPSFDPVSIGGGMGLVLTVATSLLALVALVALARLVVGEEFRSTLRWHH